MFHLSQLIAPQRVLLVTDEISAPSDFFLHRCLSAHLKEQKEASVVIVSMSGDFSRWKAIAAKSNLNLSQSMTTQATTFIDVLQAMGIDPSTDMHQTTLHPLYRKIRSVMEESDESTASRKLVILDDISSLEWIGFSVLDIIRFARALRSLCLKTGSSLLIQHHTIPPGELDDLFRFLLQICTYYVDVRPLSSGKSGAVSGEIALHAGPLAHFADVQTIPRSRSIQYRLTDGGAVFFEKGTGEAVL